jgi:hypothetical protein
MVTAIRLIREAFKRLAAEKIDAGLRAALAG